jgi:hypothetical protein
MTWSDILKDVLVFLSPLALVVLLGLAFKFFEWLGR